MRLTKIRVANVKGLPDGEYTLSPVTFVCGGNRSGKTAILQAVQYAVFGRCDEMGAKGVGALVRTGCDHCTIECQSEGAVFFAKISVGKKGTVSQSRSCEIDGREVTDAEVARLVGDVPVTLAQLAKLTGEEMWRLIMPSGSDAELPEHVQRPIEDLMGRLEMVGKTTCAVSLKQQMESDADCVSRATSLMESITILQRESRETARALLKTSDPDSIVPYSGPPIADLRIEEKELKERMRAFQESVRQINQLKQTVEYNRQQVTQSQQILDRANIDISRLGASIGKAKELADQIDELLIAMPDFIDHARFGSMFFTADVRQLLDAVGALNEEHEMCILAARFSECVNQYVAQRTYVQGADCHLDEMIQQCQQGAAEFSLKATDVSRSAFETLRLEISKRMLRDNAELQQLEAAKEKAIEKINTLTNENLMASLQLDSVNDDSQMAINSQRLSSILDLISQAQAYNTRIALVQSARADVTRLQALDPFFDHAIEELQAYRASLLTSGIEAVQECANRIITEAGLTPIVLEPVSGKRPSLLVRNEAGSQYAAMSGAERLIYGAALIRSIQAVCKVGMSLLFLEGGELDAEYTGRFVNSLDRCGGDGNVLIAHWLTGSSIKPEVGVIHV